MHLSFESLLLLGILSFYLYDSLMLLYFNEVVFSLGLSGWGFSNPNGRWRVAGKKPYIPNLFSPFSPTFRLSWSKNKRELVEYYSEDFDTFLNELKLVGYPIITLMYLIFICLPIALLKFGAGIQLLIIMCSIYLTIGFTSILIYRKRNSLKLTNKMYWSIVFDAFACPPFSINIVRKISLNYPLRIDAVEFGSSNLNDKKFMLFIDSIKSKLDEELESEAKNSKNALSIKQYKSILSGIRK